MIRNQNNNKILIISHIADCDGMGSVILGIKYLLFLFNESNFSSNEEFIFNVSLLIIT